MFKDQNVTTQTMITHYTIHKYKHVDRPLSCVYIVLTLWSGLGSTACTRQPLWTCWVLHSMSVGCTLSLKRATLSRRTSHPSSTWAECRSPPRRWSVWPRRHIWDGVRQILVFSEFRRTHSPAWPLTGLFGVCWSLQHQAL